MVSFEVEGTGEDARRVSEAMRLFTLAPSLGGVESLVSIPVLTSHAMIPAEERAKMGVTEQMIRLSVGIENADDLIADLEHALEAVAAAAARASRMKAGKQSRLSEPGSLLMVSAKLENKLQRQLQNSRIVCGSWPEQHAGQAGRIARRVVGTAVADNRAGGVPCSGIRTCRSSVAAQPVKFRVIEHVEGFRPEFKVLALSDREVFEQGHVEVRPPGIVQICFVRRRRTSGLCGATNAAGLKSSGPNPAKGVFWTPVLGSPTRSGYEPPSEAAKVADLRSAGGGPSIVGGRDRADCVPKRIDCGGSVVVHAKGRAALN